MKLISVYSPSYSELKEKWFLPSVKDNIEIETHLFDSDSEAKCVEPGSSELECFKCGVIIKSLKDNPGQILIISNADIEFFRPVRKRLVSSVQSLDLVCRLGDPNGSFSAGFFAMRSNRLCLQLWEQVFEAVKNGDNIQPAFNRIIKSVRGLHYGYLPAEFFGVGTFRISRRTSGYGIYIPKFPVMFQADGTDDSRKKNIMLRRIKRTVQLGRPGIITNNLLWHIVNSGKNNPASVSDFIREFNRKAVSNSSCFSRPRRVCLDASTVCQLACRTCPTSRGIIKKNIGSGFLSPEDFEKFLRDQPWVTEIELSNWGEVFLNPRLKDIFKLAREYSVLLKIENGANLNTANDEILEDVVRYKIRSITCSIDGASQETYSIYRVKGNFDKVIENIKKINLFKEKYSSPFPALLWQFVAFGHNEHEIEKARRLAGELKMKFNLKLSWEDLYFESFSPVNDRALIRSEMPSSVADRNEYEEKFGKIYISKCCNHLFQSPRINYDGRLLGCSINYWEDFGNVFEKGLEECLNSEKIKACRDLLMGHKTDRKDLPCFKCNVYKSRVKLGSFVTLQDLNELM